MKNSLKIDFFGKKTGIVQTSIFCLLCFTSLNVTGAESTAALVKAGDKLVSQKKFSDAIVTYHNALKQGENPEIYYKLGTAYSRLKESGAAAHYYREAIRHAKLPARKILYYQDLAGVYQSTRDFNGMENVYKVAFQDPEMANDKLQKRLIAYRDARYRTWISVFMQQKRYDSALRLLEAQKTQLNKKQYYQFLSRIRQAEALNLIRDKKQQEALKLLRDTIAMEPSMSPADNALLYGTLINALTKQKMFKEAQAELNKFTAADREKYSVAVIFADYYSTQKQYEKAIECLNAVKKDTDAKLKRMRYFKICDYYLRQNDGKKAFEYYRKAKTAVKDKWRVPGYEHRIKELHPEATF